MKTLAISAVLLVTTLRWHAAYAADDDGDLDLDDADLDDDEDEEGTWDMGTGTGSGAGDSAVAEFDADMPEETRKKRMKACFVYTLWRSKFRGKELQQQVEEMTSSEEESEQTFSATIYSWMMTCYIVIDEANIRDSLTPDSVPEEIESQVFGVLGETNAGVKDASKRQWSLLSKVMAEETSTLQEKADAEMKKQGIDPEQQNQQRPQQPSPQPTPSGVRSEPEPNQGFGLTYVLAVLPIIFGLIGLAVQRLSQAASPTQKLSKAERKAEKKGNKAS